MEERIRADLWKAIQAHYERKDYTEAVRDTIFHICEVLRDKSGLVDKDGTKLIDSALLGSNPLVLINKNETTTEKNIQQGVGLALKGIMLGIRDLISHEKTLLSEDEAEVLILYINYLLNQIDKSKAPSKICDIKDLLFDQDFTGTEEYAKCLIKEVPSKKRYDLLIDLYNERAQLPQNTLRFFMKELINSQTKASLDDFIRIVSSSLIRCKNDSALRMYFHYFMVPTYEKIDKLAQLRIEDLILKSLKCGKIEEVRDRYGSLVEAEVNPDGTLATWVSGRIRILNSHDKMIDTLYEKINRSQSEAKYVLQYFASDLIRDDYSFKPYDEYTIKKLLLDGNKEMFKTISSLISFPTEDDEISIRFGKELEKCRVLLYGDEDIPF